MKSVILSCICIICSIGSFAQQKAILLVPFDSKLFNIQDSKMMLEESDMSYEQCVQFVTTSLDEHLTQAVKDSLRVHSLLRTYTTDAYNDVDIIHDQADYVLTERPHTLSQKKELSAFEKTKQRFNARRNKKKKQEKKSVGGEVVSEKVDNSNKFLSVKFQDPQAFIELVHNYSAQYVVFITQFEILSDYSNPYAVAEHNYPRTIRIHYAIFDNTGSFVFGDIETGMFTAEENNIATICNSYFPVMTKKIMRKVP
ncbi:MAG: hypothetical protein R6U95_00895 [Bacteroidales bacterium]